MNGVRKRKDSILKSRDITLPTKVCLVKAMVFPVVTYRYESWAIKKTERRRIDAFELWCWRRLFRESLGVQGDQTIQSWNQFWIFLGRTDAEAEARILWPPDVKNWLTRKNPDAEKDWRREEKGMTEDEMVGWHHRLDGHEFEQTLGAGNGQGGLVCHSPWDFKELDTSWATELNWNH